MLRGRIERARSEGVATRARHKPTDHTDICQCLEIAHAAGVTADTFTDSDEVCDGADLVRSLFSDRHGPGMSAMSEDQGPISGTRGFVP